MRCAVVLPTGGREVHADEPLCVLFLTKNVGTGPVEIATTGPLGWIFTIRVLDPDGKPAPLTAYGSEQMGIPGGSRSVREVAPGAQAENRLLLGRLFDMTRQGNYIVSFSRLAWRDGDGVFWVASNEFKVVVKGQKAE